MGPRRIYAEAIYLESPRPDNGPGGTLSRTMGGARWILLRIARPQCAYCGFRPVPAEHSCSLASFDNPCLRSLACPSFSGPSTPRQMASNGFMWSGFPHTPLNLTPSKMYGTNPNMDTSPTSFRTTSTIYIKYSTGNPTFGRCVSTVSATPRQWINLVCVTVSYRTNAWQLCKTNHRCAKNL